ncbi:hypothetical protein [Streptomyces qinglanensis]|uniref:hypothetical protein n=1 Tax=Streptomyces qinglanensis TaxID=943816 RepID=UPI000941F159|nr:hypothetical protein [Streptomyces qinglanensis]
MARAREAARPFIPGRHLATSLCTGSRALLERGAAWVAAGDGTQGSVTRLGGVAAGAVGIVLLVDQHPPMMTPLTAAWCVAAWTLAPAPTPRNDQDEPGEEQPAEAVPPAAHIVALAIREITADTGQRGAHLDTIADALPGATKQTVRQALDAAGIPVTEGLNLKAAGGRQRNRQGVLLRDLPDGLGHLPDTPAPGPPGSPDRGPAYTPVTPHPQPGPAPAPHTPNSPHPPAR